MGDLAGSPVLTIILAVVGVVLVGFFGYRAIKSRRDKK